MKRSTPLQPLPALALALVLLGAGLAGAQTSAPASAPKARASSGAALPAGTRVTLNFVNADIEAVTRAMGAMLNQQIVVDPRVKGTITVYSEQPMTVREAYVNYLAALRGLGFTVVENAGLMKVVPEADAKLQAGTVSIGEVNRRGDQILTQIFRLNHENPNNLVAILRPLISPNNTINANPGNNSLVITDYADNLARIGKIIAALDQPNASDIEVVPLQHGVAADLAPLVQRLADGGSGAPVPGVPAQAGSGAVSVVVDSRSNALMVRAANPARAQQVRAIIDKLDRPTQGGGPAGNVWVVHLKNADATKMAQVLRAAFAQGGSGASAGGGSSPLPATVPTNIGTGAAAGATSAAAAPIQASQGPSTGGFIQADPSTNSLIVTAAEPLYRQVRAMIDQLDTRRAQVYIESLIVEVSGDNAADFGFQWQGLIGKDGDRNVGVIGTNLGNSRVPSIIDINTSAAAGTVAVGAGLNIGLIHSFGGQYALAAIAQFLQTQNNTNIMSTPNLITLDNEEAKIVVGSNVPFITGQFTSTGTGTTNPFQTVERKDVGLTLRIKPQIGEGGTVRLTIFQESTDVIAQATGTSGTGPTTSKRSIESNVVVDDGSILVLGGLIEDRFEDNKSKVPLLGDIPVVGHLFRSESRTKRRTNLMVFLRPIVMRSADDAKKLSLDRYDLIRGQQLNAKPDTHILLPVGEAPVLPPQRAPQAPTTLPPVAAPAPAPASAPASAPAN
ncbi:MAG TPA: type II secretion system secretin GspD [Burkholderiaceae bacterium]|nr:type II secretion system secretin GspD [Burkholderiaceae bacterium]